MRATTRLRAPVSRQYSQFQPHIISTFRSRPHAPATITSPTSVISRYPIRTFSISSSRWKEDYASQAKALNQKSLDEHEDGFNKQIDNAIGQAEELQARTPWHREGSDRPPVKRERSAGAMTKGTSIPLHDPSTTTNHNTNTKI
jgi:hypothetical protein